MALSCRTTQNKCENFAKVSTGSLIKVKGRDISIQRCEVMFPPLPFSLFLSVFFIVYFYVIVWFCDAEFAEMQLNITDIKRDLVSTGIPYHSYQSYTQYLLFPKEVEAGSLSALLHHTGVGSPKPSICTAFVQQRVIYLYTGRSQTCQT